MWSELVAAGSFYACSLQTVVVATQLLLEWKHQKLLTCLGLFFCIIIIILGAWGGTAHLMKGAALPGFSGPTLFAVMLASMAAVITLFSWINSWFGLPPVAVWRDGVSTHVWRHVFLYGMCVVLSSVIAALVCVLLHTGGKPLSFPVPFGTAPAPPARREL